MNDPADRWDSPLDKPTDRGSAFFKSLTAADEKIADLDALKALINDPWAKPDWRPIAMGIATLVDRYYADAADCTQVEAITNLAGLLRHASGFAGALCRDIEHYREEAVAARELARQAQDREVDLLSLNVIDVVHLVRQRTWSECTFGPGARAAGNLDHIAKELDEIRDNPDDLEEWVDVIILAFDGAMRRGWEPQQVIDAIVEKQAENEQRTWPDWRTADPDKAIEHVRDETL